MPKAKTHKATRKRFKISGKKKFLARAAGQDHFNARESGKTTVKKRRDNVASRANVEALRRMMPYFRKRS